MKKLYYGTIIITIVSIICLILFKNKSYIHKLLKYKETKKVTIEISSIYNKKNSIITYDNIFSKDIIDFTYVYLSNIDYKFKNNFYSSYCPNKILCILENVMKIKLNNIEIYKPINNNKWIPTIEKNKYYFLIIIRNNKWNIKDKGYVIINNKNTYLPNNNRLFLFTGIDRQISKIKDNPPYLIMGEIIY